MVLNPISTEPCRNSDDLLNDGRENQPRAAAATITEQGPSGTHVRMNQSSLPHQVEATQSMAPEFPFSIDPIPNYDLAADSWGGGSIDMAWLSTLPFEINFDETIDPLW